MCLAYKTFPIVGKKKLIFFKRQNNKCQFIIKLNILQSTNIYILYLFIYPHNTYNPYTRTHSLIQAILINNNDTKIIIFFG